MEGSVAGPAQGTPPPAAQPAATGQGDGGQGQQSTGPGQGSNFNWGLFPNVPENQRELLQPHLTNVLGHVTRMEQQYAPYKGLMDTVSPDQVQNLLTFISNYNQDPVSTWMGLGQSLREDGTIKNPNFSLDQLQALVAEQAQGPQQGMEDMPPWAQQMAQQMQGIMQYVDSRQQQDAQVQQQETERQQQAILAEAHTTIRDALKNAGIPEGLVTDEQITAELIVRQGDINQVVSSFTGLRDGFLGNFTNQNSNGQRPPTISGKPPEAPKNGLRGRKGDEFREASLGAQQFLAQAAAQEGN